MPAKWQQWMPFKIDAFISSSAVQAMHPAARSGYLYLLARAWQTEDCAIANDPIELAEMSGLGDELWATYGARILRKFDVIEGDRLRNAVEYGEWQEAKRVFEARRKSAERTNTARSPQQKPTVTAQGPSRSADTHTYTGTGTETEVQNTPPGAGASAPPHVPPQRFDGFELQAANELLLENSIPSDQQLTRIAGQSLVFECERLGTPERAVDAMRIAIAEGKARGDTINRFWFSDQRYLPQKTIRNGVANGSSADKQSPAKQRVIGNLEALYTATLERADEAPGGGGEDDGTGLPVAGLVAVPAGMAGGLRGSRPETFRRPGDGRAEGAAHPPRATVLPPTR